MVGSHTELSIQGCTLRGAPAITREADEIDLGGLMAVGSYSRVSISDSKLICQHSPRVLRQVHTLSHAYHPGCINSWVQQL
jgi:hypothetical protein